MCTAVYRLTFHIVISYSSLTPSLLSSPTRRIGTHKDVVAETRVITALILLLHIWIEWLIEVRRVELERGVDVSAILDVRVPSVL